MISDSCFCPSCLLFCWKQTDLSLLSRLCLSWMKHFDPSSRTHLSYWTSGSSLTTSLPSFWFPWTFFSRLRASPRISSLGHGIRQVLHSIHLKSSSSLWNPFRTIRFWFFLTCSCHPCPFIATSSYDIWSMDSEVILEVRPFPSSSFKLIYIFMQSLRVFKDCRQRTSSHGNKIQTDDLVFWEIKG